MYVYIIVLEKIILIYYIFQFADNHLIKKFKQEIVLMTIKK